MTRDPSSGTSDPASPIPHRASSWAFGLLCLFAFLTPFIAPAYIVTGPLLIAWILELRREPRRLDCFRSPFVFLFVLLALLTILSAIFSRDPAASSHHLGGLGLFLLVPATMDLVDGPSRARTLVLWLSASAVALSVYGIWQFLHGGDDLQSRIRATLSHYMTFSGIALLSACMLLGFAFEEKGRRRAIGLLAILPLTAVLLTFTRNAYVGIVVALVLYGAVRRPKLLPAVAAALVLVYVAAPREIRDRIRSTADLSDATNRDRIAMVHAGARMVAENPVFGLGADMVEPYYPLYRDPDAPRWSVPHLHDNVVQLAAGNGLFAAGAYLAIVAVFLATAITKLRRGDDPARSAIWAGALLAGAAITIAGFFEYNFGDTEVEMATLLILALPFSRAANAPAG
ncbi:MAG TPA: O-antigen ligase family protein [Thermoanaerobaculia bacterium]|nr:O-antigen ligase family protein [Thermoanaerobaculia bacterium]